MQLKFAINILLLLAVSCGEKTFDAELQQEQQAGGTGDAVTKIVAEDMSSIPVEPAAMFVLNPVGAERSRETINLAQTQAVTKTIRMESERSLRRKRQTAARRRWHEKKVTQTGSHGTPMEQTFVRDRHKGLLDLLLVIDDSVSMQDEHGYLSNGLSKLLNQINKSNWKIKIVDVDDRRICEHTIITTANQGEYSRFISNLSTSPNIEERTLQKAEAALGIGGRCSSSWLRPKSTLAVVIITDENQQCSNSRAADRYDGISSNNSFRCSNLVANFIRDFKKLREHTVLYGIFDNRKTCQELRGFYNSHDPPYTCAGYHYHNRNNARCGFINPCYKRDGNYKYKSASFLAHESKFNGIARVDGDQAAYNNILRNIASQVKAKLQNQFTLQEEPDPDTVTVNGMMRSHFSLSGKILTFNRNPGTNIVVKYTPQSGVKRFISRISVDDNQADLSTLEVRVAGKILEKNTHYTVAGNTVTINNAPQNFPTDAVATIRWHKQMRYETKQREFLFGGRADIATVSIPGYPASSYSVTRDSNNRNIVIFNSGQEPDYGAEFVVNFESYGSAKLTYPHNYTGTYEVKTVSCSPVPCTRSGGDIVFNSGDFQRGRDVIVTLTVEGLEADRRPVPQHYVADSLELTLGGNKCTAKQLVINAGKLMLTTSDATNNGCDMLAALKSNPNQDMELSYLLFTPQQEIEVGLDNLIPEYAGYSSEYWEVFVADQQQEEGKDYTVSGRKITFTGEHAPDTKGEVKIFVKY